MSMVQLVDRFSEDLHQEEEARRNAKSGQTLEDLSWIEQSHTAHKAVIQQKQLRTHFNLWPELALYAT